MVRLLLLFLAAAMCAASLQGMPVAVISPSTLTVVCGQPIVFGVTGSHGTDAHVIVDYRWEFPSGESLPGSQVSYVFPTHGVHRSSCGSRMLRDAPPSWRSPSRSSREARPRWRPAPHRKLGPGHLPGLGKGPGRPVPGRGGCVLRGPGASGGAPPHEGEAELSRDLGSCVDPHGRDAPAVGFLQRRSSCPGGPHGRTATRLDQPVLGRRLFLLAEVRDSARWPHSRVVGLRPVG